MRLLFGQTGAPTAVVNESLAGFLEGAGEEQVLTVRCGPTGLVNGDYISAERLGPSAQWRRQGGSVIGGGRRAITSDDLDAVLESLALHRIDALALVGGNGTMAFLQAIAGRAQAAKQELRVVGIPKTIDNDLPGIDHSPGFASAATYLSQIMPDIARDHTAMKNIEPVRIVETMGRSTGWLAAAAAYPGDGGNSPADLVISPEQKPSVDQVLGALDDRIADKGQALVVVSEGVFPELSQQPIEQQNHTALLTGGVARRLVELVGTQLGMPARAEILGVTQRSAAVLGSQVDREEAYTVGYRAARALTGSPDSGVMVGIERKEGSDYEPRYPLIPLADLTGTRPLPAKWVHQDPRKLTDFFEWLKPLIAPPVSRS